MYLKDLQAAGKSSATLRSYGMDLLRWLRFLWAIECQWNEATRTEARDFSRWIQIVTKPRPPRRRPPEAVNAVTGKPAPSPTYAKTTIAHSETVLRSFYDFHLEAESGPLINPFPLDRARRRGRSNAHHNPMTPYRNQRSGLYRPKVAERPPRCIPDEQFNELFSKLRSHRDRALVAFYVSTGARAEELLGAVQGDVDVGQQLIAVVRKGSRRIQQLPASPDAFVWLRLYQAQMQDLVPDGRDEPLWWTLRRPFRQLTYHALYRMLARVTNELGANWTLHDLRHTAAYRMARDPDLPLTDVQWILGHAHLSTTQLYLNAPAQDVIAAVLAHHARTAQAAPARPQGHIYQDSAYRPETLDILFGKRT